MPGLAVALARASSVLNHGLRPRLPGTISKGGKARGKGSRISSGPAVKEDGSGFNSGSLQPLQCNTFH